MGIDAEVHRIVVQSYERAKRILNERRDRLVAIAESLLSRETLDGNDVDILMKGGTLPPPKSGPGPTAPATGDGLSADPGLNPALKPA